MTAGLDMTVGAVLLSSIDGASGGRGAKKAVNHGIVKTTIPNRVVWTVATRTASDGVSAIMAMIGAKPPGEDA